MQMMIKRDKELATDRKGRPKNATYKISYRLLPNAEESTIIEQHNLGSSYVIGDFQHGFTLAELTQGGQISESSSDLALGKQNTFLKGARNAAALVKNVRAFDGMEQTIELGQDPD